MVTIVEKIAMSRAKDPRGVINISLPAGLTPFPFQLAGVEYMGLQTNSFNADDMGLGKTIEEILFIIHNNIKTALIICPAALTYVWENQLIKWLGLSDNECKVFEPKMKSRDCRFLIMSYGHAHNLKVVGDIIAGFKYEHLILDEAHFLKNPKAKRTKHILAKNGLRSKVGSIHAVSGTPITARPMDIYPLLKTLDHSAIDNMSSFEFGLEYCAGWQSPWGWDFKGASNLKKLGTKLRAKFLLRRKKEAVLDQLPPKFINMIRFKPGNEGRAWLKTLSTFNPDLELNAPDSPEFTKMSEARAALGLTKIDFAIDYIKTLIEGGVKKLVVFAHHIPVVTTLREELERIQGVEVLTIVGGMGPKAKYDAQEKFQNSLARQVMLVSISAGGYGLTLTAAASAVFVEFPWNPSDLDQAMDRLYRIGQNKAVTIDFLVYGQTLDERILEVNLAKIKIMKELYD
jgi:SWI/SNF-related matrix-associated actin-dependent regulator 1 of chromatin subfamily A